MEFRFKALRHAHDPDDLDVPVNLASPKSWIAVFVVLVVVAGAGLWAFAGTLPQTEQGRGVLSRPDGVVRVEIGYLATVTGWSVSVGATVAAGQRLATVTDPQGDTHAVTAPVAGSVMVADLRPGVVVQPGEPIAVLRSAAPGGGALEAMVVVPTAAAAAIRPGMAVDLTVDSVPARAFGLLRGRVSAVSQYPVTADGLSSLIYDQTLIATLLKPGAAVLVTIDLLPDPDTVSGFRWSSPSGPPYRLQFQSAVTASFHLPDRRPIDYVFGDSA